MIFDEKALSKALNNVVPPGKNNAVLFTLDNKTGAKIAVHVVKQQEHFDWAVDGVYEHKWTGDNSVLGQVGFYW